MKRFYILSILFIGWSFSVNAQDLIILKDGNTIEVKVLEISPTEIRYKRFDHLEGPTIVVLTENVLSIRYENGRTEIINTVTQPTTTTQSTSTQPTTAQVANQLIDRNPRFNTLGLTLGYLGVSNFGFSLNGTVSPAPYTFFDFNMGLGFASFSFNGNINFNGFVPFSKGGWYGGIGLGGGVYELADSMNGYFAINVITGFLFFNWLNISATLQMELVPEFNIRFKPMVGYIYRFKPLNDSVTSTEEASVSQQETKEKRQQMANVRNNWISFELAFLGVGARYERMLNSKVSLGANVWGPLWFADYFEINTFFRFYPWGKTFFLGAGLGYNRHRVYYYYEDSFAIIPEIGWKIDVGQAGGFYLMPCITLPLAFGKKSSSFSGGYRVIYFGMGYAF